MIEAGEDKDPSEQMEVATLTNHRGARYRDMGVPALSETPLRNSAPALKNVDGAGMSMCVQRWPRDGRRALRGEPSKISSKED